MAKVMVIRDWNTGKVLKKVAIKTFRSISYEVEHIGAGRFLVIRDYYDNSIVQKINVSKFGSIEFEARYDDEDW